jgi:hypothetical protein
MTKRPTPNFYRELVKCTQDVRLLRETALTVTNVGMLAAKEIRVELVLPDPKRVWEFCAEGDFPTQTPSRYSDPFMGPPVVFRGAHRSGEPDYEFDYIDGAWHLTFEFGHLQPGRTLWPALKVYVGAREAATVTLTGRVMADGLSTAASCRLDLTARVSESEGSLDELLKRLKALKQSDDD